MSHPSDGGPEGTRYLPPDFPVSEGEEVHIEELAHCLRRGYAEGLAGFSVDRVVKAVDTVARRLLDPHDGLRKRVLRDLPSQAGFSPPMASAILDGMARDWTRNPLERLLEAEFPDPGVLDGFRVVPQGGRARAMGYPLTLHIGAGSVPGVATTSLIRGLLVKSAVLLKPGRGNLTLPVAFCRGLEEVDPEIARAVAVLYWRGSEEPSPDAAEDTYSEGEASAYETALRVADLVVVYGGDETVRWIRNRLPVATPLRAYRHRVGVGLVGRMALNPDEDVSGEAVEAAALALEVARSVALFDQRGCVSPKLLFVEEGGRVTPAAWAALLGEALETIEQELPAGPPSPEEGAALQQLRGAGEMKEAAGDGAVYHGGSRAPWTVLFEPGGKLEPICGNRTVKVVPVVRVAEALSELEGLADHLQTVGVEGLGEERDHVVEALARMGVSRVVGFSQVPWPPPWWHHDGEGPLRTLVRWTDAE